jgi:hypothetical protein
MKEFLSILIFFIFLFSFYIKSEKMMTNNLENKIKSVKKIYYKPGDSIIKAITSNRNATIDAYYNFYTIYSKNGVPIEMYFRDKNGELYEKRIKTLDENGKLIEGKMYDPVELIEKWDYIYDDKGNCTSINYFDSKGRLRREVNKYDKENRPVEFIYYDHNGDVGFRSIDQYNEKGQVKNIITFENYNSSITIESYEYNDDNNVIKISYYKLKAYDRSRQEYIKGELKRQRSFSYVLDSYGNWITKKEKLNGVLNKIWERKIEYF